MSSQELLSNAANSNATDNDDKSHLKDRVTKTILVASLNPVKIAAALHGFQAMFPETPFVARGISVPSGVPDQPFSDQETLQGASNRAFNARAAEPTGVDFWVGIEGGVCDVDDPSYPELNIGQNQNVEVQRQNKALQCFAWVVVLGYRNWNTTNAAQEEEREPDFIMGKARTSTYYLPEETSRLVRGGMELGPAEDRVWGRTNSKQQNGSIGLLTGDVVDRTGGIQQAVVLALIPFRNPRLRF